MNVWTTPEREALRKTVRDFAEREVLPNVDEWERSGHLPRELHRKAGEAGLLGAGLPDAVGHKPEYRQEVATPTSSRCAP